MPSAPPPVRQEERQAAAPSAPHRPHSAPNSSRRKPPIATGQDASVTGFLRRLLPRDFDTGDLIVVLLLLLMAGDCCEDQNTALLTLALYVFM